MRHNNLFIFNENGLLVGYSQAAPEITGKPRLAIPAGGCCGLVVLWVGVVRVATGSKHSKSGAFAVPPPRYGTESETCCFQ